MCGLIGGNNPRWPYEAVIGALKHRGPDSQAVLNVGPVTLGFSRLAVIDRSHTANQPMRTLDGRVSLVFNGEIYGFQSLRSVLMGRGHQFRTTGDTEVILHAWLEWGPDFVERIDGMFAIAVYDCQDRRIHLFRDRVGIKPLYYLWDGNNFAFASELKAIEQLCGIQSLRVDNTALYDFLTYGYIPTPKSLYRHVFKLPPASRLVFDVEHRAITHQGRYWELPAEPQPKTRITDAADELPQLIGESVREQLVADVPVGCFLSGGIDSGVVVATAASCVDRLRTFSVGFDCVEHSETGLARETAERFETQHREVTFRSAQIWDQLQQLRSLYCEPFADTSAFPTAVVSRFAKQTVTVALSGDGGDELFGGYKWYRRYLALMRLGATRLPGPVPWLEQLFARLPSGTVRKKLAGAASMATMDELSLYVQLMGGLTKVRKQDYATALGIDADYDDCWHYREHWRPQLPLLTRLQYLDFHTYLPDDILTKVDRASMACSLEVRVPMLSRRLIEFAFSLPENIRYDGGRLKGVLKRVYRHTLPDSILRRPKKGFSVPPSHLSCFEGRLREAILAQNYGIRTDANCLPFRFDDSVAHGEQHPSHEDVPGIRRRGA